MTYLALFIVFFLSMALLLWPLRRSRAGLVLLACFALFCCAVYAVVGSPRIVPLLAARNERMAELKQQILIHSNRVKENSDDLESWVVLGQSFIETGQYAAAANAFKQSVILSQGDPRLILAYAKSMIISEDGKVSDAAKKSLEMVLLQDKKNAEARYWLVVRKLQDGDNANAMKEMKALYNELPEDSELKSQINRQIGRD